MTTGRLHSIETFGAVDGPGIRTVFFLQGCPARCLYCHNPDSWGGEGGRPVLAQEILDRAKRSLNYYGDEGGVTFSGGEPLLQGEFLLEAISLLKENGIRSVVDTSGTYVDGCTRAIFEACQVILLDIKHSDPERFREISGCGQETLMETIRLANESGTPVWIRQVIVPGLNDTEENMDALAGFINTNIKNLHKVELLAYHTMALDKYRKLGISYPLEGVATMDKDRLAQLEEKLNCRIAK